LTKSKNKKEENNSNSNKKEDNKDNNRESEEIEQQENIDGEENNNNGLEEFPKKVGKEDFILMCVIGQGSFGKVMQVKHKKSNKIYAMKVMRKETIILKDQVTHTNDEKTYIAKKFSMLLLLI